MTWFDGAKRVFSLFFFFLNNTIQTANKREIDIFISLRIFGLRNRYDWSLTATTKHAYCIVFLLSLHSLALPDFKAHSWWCYFFRSFVWTAFNSPVIFGLSLCVISAQQKHRNKRVQINHVMLLFNWIGFMKSSATNNEKKWSRRDHREKNQTIAAKHNKLSQFEEIDGKNALSSACTTKNRKKGGDFCIM